MTDMLSELAVEWRVLWVAFAAKQNYRNLPLNGSFSRNLPFLCRQNSIGFFVIGCARN
jgi:hypothetical protein